MARHRRGPLPAWLIAQGADATGEALLGLAAYVEATGDAQSRQDLARLAEGVASMSAGDADEWPYGAVLPWALSQAMWHAWGGLAPAGLAAASDVTGSASTLAAAIADTASFTPHLMVAGGPDNCWLPTPIDQVQIAYGAESRIESLLTVATVADRPGLATLAGIAASWFFGANAAGEQMYDPTTGRTLDGITASGTVNRNSGAESTIHGLLAMLALDAHPDLIPIAQTATTTERHTARLVEAESGVLTGDASIYQPASAWTGESQWSGGAGVLLESGATLQLDLPYGEKALLMPVVNLEPTAGLTTWQSGSTSLGTIDQSAIGAQGDSPAAGLLAVQTLPGALHDDQVTVTATGGATLIDAVLVQPTVEWLTLASSAGRGTALVRSFVNTTTTTTIAIPGSGRATVTAYDSTGRQILRQTTRKASIKVTIPAGGFALVIRE